MKELELIAELMAASKLTQGDLARALGVSRSYVNQALKGAEVADGLRGKILAYLQNSVPLAALKDEADEHEFIETTDAVAIHQIIDWTTADGEMGAVAGIAGSGKTRAVKEYASSHPNAMLYEAAPTVTPKTLLLALCKLAGCEQAGTINDLLLRLATVLKGKRRVLIIDEAEQLNHRCLEIARRLHDFSATPLVLVGTRKLLNNLNGNGKSGYYEYEQLCSRVGSKWECRGLDDDDLRAVCGRFGVSDAQCVKAVANIAQRNFRSTLKLLARARRLDAAMSLKAIKSAASMLHFKGI